MVSLTPPQINKEGDVVLLSAVPSTSPASNDTAQLVKTCAATCCPRSTPTGMTSYVGGFTASYVDLAALITARLLLVIGTVILLGFILLMIAFRSLLIPLQAAVTNLLSAAAAFGVLTAAFQWGWGISLLGIDTPDSSVPIASYVPLMMFAGAVRALDGLRGLPGQPRRPPPPPGRGGAPGGRLGPGVQCPDHHGGGADHGVGLRQLHPQRRPDHQAVRRRPGRRGRAGGDPGGPARPGVLVLFGKAAWWLPGWLDKILPHIDIEGRAARQPREPVEAAPAPAEP